MGLPDNLDLGLRLGPDELAALAISTCAQVRLVTKVESGLYVHILSRGMCNSLFTVLILVSSPDPTWVWGRDYIKYSPANFYDSKTCTKS